MNLILENKNKIIFFVFTFVIMFMRFIYYGFEYYPQLDDYIQYYSYRNFLGTIPEIINKLGLLSARPLSGIMDITIWDYFFNTNMIIGVFFISIMYTSTAFIVKKAFSYIFDISNLFIFIVLLLPLGFEGTYWVSASSRIVVGMFFTSLGILFFSLYCQKGSIKYIPLFIVFQLISFGFYEQVIVFSITATFLIMIGFFYNDYVSKTEEINKRIFLAFCTFLNVAIFILISIFFKNSSIYSSRMDLILPYDKGYFDIFLPDIIKQIIDVFVYGNFFTTFKGFFRGLTIILNDKSIIYFVLLVALCVSVSIIEKKEGSENKYVLKLVFGILLFIAPITPFFILANPWFSFRGAVISFFGMALIFDVIFDFLFKDLNIRSFVMAFVIFIFSVAGVSEISDYRNNSISDKNISKLYLDTVDKYGYTGDMKVGIFNINEFHSSNNNYDYHEHIASVSDSDWSFLGACRYFAKKFSIPEPIPLNTDGYLYVPRNKDNSVKNIDKFLWYDSKNNDMVEVISEKINDFQYNIYDKETNYLYKTVEYNDEYGFFTFD